MITIFNFFKKYTKEKRLSFIMFMMVTLISSVFIDGDQVFYYLLTVYCVVFIHVVLMFRDKIEAKFISLQRLNINESILFSLCVRKNIFWLTIPVIVIFPFSIVISLCWLVAVFLIYGLADFVFIHKFLSRKRAVKKAKDAYLEENFQLVVYVSGMRNVGYQINQWLPVLDKLTCRTVIIIRQLHIFNEMLPTTIPVYFAAGHRDVEWLLHNGPKTVIYPANTAQNVQALREYQLNHYFINHGESDKAVNQNKLLMAYDKLLVGGPLAERRLKKAGLPIRDRQIEYVGRPQAELLLQPANNNEKTIKNILYAPTWEGFVENVNYSSVGEVGLSILKAIIENSNTYNIIFKSHPFTGNVKSLNKKYLAEMIELCKRNNVKVLGDKDSLYDAMNWSDILVTDISSVLNEYLVTDKPIILCNVKNESETCLFESFPSSKAAYIYEANVNIMSVLDDVKAEDRLKEQRKLIRIDSMGDSKTSALDKFSSVIYKSLI